jgi:hypothetical protein
MNIKNFIKECESRDGDKLLLAGVSLWLQIVLHVIAIVSIA